MSEEELEKDLFALDEEALLQILAVLFHGKEYQVWGGTYALAFNILLLYRDADKDGKDRIRNLVKEHTEKTRVTSNP